MYDLDAVEIRILGSLLEKQRTTPDTYPLTLNALRLACNQSTNRDPVVDFDEVTIQDALQRLHRRELTRVASGHGSRASKYRHLLAETLTLSDAEAALLCVLLLRGDQTPGELKQRTERLHPFTDLAAVEDDLTRMSERGLVARLERRPGEKQVRFRHLLAGDDAVSGSEPPARAGTGTGDAVSPLTVSPAVSALTAPAGNGLAVEIAQLRASFDSLRAEVADLRARIDTGEGATDASGDE